jgi:murein DD-endopeptidase MepM/ murein hydrolase activator NlpD
VEENYQKILELAAELQEFLSELAEFVIKKLHLSFIRIEAGKGAFVSALYRQRGRQSKRLIHSSIAGLAAIGMIMAPVVADEFPGRTVDPWTIPNSSAVLSATAAENAISTDISQKGRDKVIDYTVVEGDTLASIAQKFDIDKDTIKWQNDLTKETIKIGQVLQILPVKGVAHKVQKGDTLSSIAKRYDAETQAIADFPFNTFLNDETFDLAVGQVIIVPDGVKPNETPTAPRIRQLAPDAGTAVASGQFVWPTSGTITQYFSWYHPGDDIANRAAPEVLAADSGAVIYSGCVSYGYGCHVIIDHGNGYRTLYGHLQRIYVNQGQGINRGVALGKMGSTGRSTGTHLHFEVVKNGVKLNPLSVLR